MRTIIGTILFILTLISCDNNNVTIPKQEYKKLIGDTSRPTYPKPFELYTDGFKGPRGEIVLGSDGHEYLVTYMDGYSTNTEHYIDCVKCIEKSKCKQIQQRLITF